MAPLDGGTRSGRRLRFARRSLAPPGDLSDDQAFLGTPIPCRGVARTPGASVGCVSAALRVAAARTASRRPAAHETLAVDSDVVLHLALAAFLLASAQPAPQSVVAGKCEGELLRAHVEGVRLVSKCRLSADYVDVEIMVQATSRLRTARRLTTISVEFRGRVETISAPPGWEFESRPRVSAGTVIVQWRPVAPASSRRMIGSAAGFRVRLRGPNAGVGCTHTLDVDGGGVGSGCAS